MKKELCSAVMTSIEALLQVPGTQLQTIEPTLRQLMTDLKNSNITPPADLDALIEEAAIAHAEDMAYYNGMRDMREDVNFSYFEKPITEICDHELISWYIMFLNGADYNDPQSKVEYDMFHAECKNRGKEFNQSVDYLDSVL